MSTSTKLWEDIAAANQRYRDLRLSDSVNYKKFYMYSIIAHSTAIEGSTLTERDAQLLFDEGITKKGTIAEHLMNLDLKNAYEYAVEEADKKTQLSPGLLIRLNALVMKNTGGIQNTMAGSFDSGLGDFRLCGVTAGVGGKSYMDYKKVPGRVDELCRGLNEKLGAKEPRDIYNLAFDAHFNLVTIHPWLDGNGRTSRLLMNYLQFYHGVVPSKIHKEDKGEYIEALQTSRDTESNEPFREFMAKQHLKSLREEIRNYEKGQEKSNRLAIMI